MVKLTFCSARNCRDFAYARNLCHKHYAQRYRGDTFIPRINGGACLADNCANKSIGKGLCWKHYRRQLRRDHKRATYACLIFHALPHWLLYLQDHPMPKLNFDDLEKPKKVRRIPKPPHPNAKPCSIPGCDDYARCRGICNKHYQYMQYHGTLPPKIVKPVDCAVDGCPSKRYAKNLCPKHYARLYRHGTVELVENPEAARIHFAPKAMAHAV
jgi:hypothetical protein